MSRSYFGIISEKYNFIGGDKVKLTIEIDFFCDGMDETNMDEVKNTLETVLDSGAESTCTELTLITIKE